jgi:hypothetical protein
MIVEGNDRSTTKGERKITLFITNCGTIQVLTWIVAEVEHWNYLLKNRMLMLRQKVIKNMTNNHQKHSWTPLDTDMFPMVEIRDFKIVGAEI